MGDHFVLLVDRLLTESTLEATIESRSQSLSGHTAVAIVQYEPGCSPKSDLEDGAQSVKIVECRICQDEDLDSNMETPCSCCGSLKGFTSGDLILPTSTGLPSSLVDHRGWTRKRTVVEC